MPSLKNTNPESFPLLQDDLKEDYYYSSGSEHSIPSDKWIMITQEKQNNNNYNNNNKNISCLNPKKLFRRISLVILPFAVLICGFSYLDRTNVAFAAMSMLHDLKMSCADYGLGSGILLLGYSVFQIPSSMIMVRIGAPVYLGIIVVIWGAVTIGFAAVQGKTGFIVVRFILGAIQAGSFPGVWYYVTLFFPKSHLTVPFAIIDLGIGIAQVIAPMLAVGLLSLDGVWGLHGWQWVFVAEGIPTMLFGIIVLSVLPKDLENAKFVSNTEKNWLQHQIGYIEDKKLQCDDKSLFMQAIRNPAIWHLSFVRFLKDMTSQGIFYWLPMVIYAMVHQGEQKQHHPHTCGKNINDQDKFQEFESILLTIIPYAVAVTTMMIIGHHSQKHGESRFHGGLPCIIGGFGLISFPFVRQFSEVGGFVGLIVSMAGYLSANPCITSLVCAHSCQASLHITLPLTDSIGIAGGFLGPFLFGLLLQATGGYTLPTLFLGVVLSLSGIVLLFIREPELVDKSQNSLLKDDP